MFSLIKHHNKLCERCIVWCTHHELTIDEDNCSQFIDEQPQLAVTGLSTEVLDRFTNPLYNGRLICIKFSYNISHKSHIPAA